MLGWNILEEVSGSRSFPKNIGIYERSRTMEHIQHTRINTPEKLEYSIEAASS